jgi:hypothetical protein
VSAFPKFQINLDYDTGMFTLRAETWDEFVENLTAATEGNAELVEALLKKIHGGVAALLDVPPRNRQEAQGNLQAGGIKSEHVGTTEHKLCPGHKVAMTLKTAQNGPRKGNKFWSCNGKNASGEWAWKSGEGCKAEDYNAETDAKYTSA